MQQLINLELPAFARLQRRGLSTTKCLKQGPSKLFEPVLSPQDMRSQVDLDDFLGRPLAVRILACCVGLTLMPRATPRKSSYG